MNYYRVVTYHSYSENQADKWGLVVGFGSGVWWIGETLGT